MMLRSYRYVFQIVEKGQRRLESVRAGRSIKVGRAPDNDLIVDHETISRHHLLIHYQESAIYIVDMGSANGTFVDGHLIGSEQRVAAPVDSTIGLGEMVTLRLTGVESSRFLPTTNHLFEAGQGWLQRKPIWTAIGGISILIISLAWLWPTHSPGEMSRSASRVQGDITLVPTFTPVTPQPATETPQNPFFKSQPTMTMASASARLPTRAPRPTVTPTTQRQAIQAAPAKTAVEPVPAVLAAGQPVGDGVEWDQRLDQLGVALHATRATGPRWRLVKAVWLNEEESRGKHHIYVDTLDENGVRIIGQIVTAFWGDGHYSGATEAKPADEYPFNYQMYAAGQAYSIKIEGLPSDIVTGMGMGTVEDRLRGVHTSFELVFQRTQ